MSDIFYKPNYPLYMNIPLGINQLELTLYIKPNSVNTMKSYYQVGYPNCVLYLQKKISSQQRYQLSKEGRASLSFPITLSNIYYIKEKFKTILSWFNDENKRLLYGKNDDGTLLFNSEYSNLNILCVSEYGSIKTALKIVPTIVEVANGIMQPGAILYINRQEHSIILRENEIIRLASFILSFNHIMYTKFVFSCMNYANETGQLIPYDEIMRRMEMNHTYDPNFKFYNT